VRSRLPGDGPALWDSAGLPGLGHTPSVYFRRLPKAQGARRGPKPTVPDAEGLELIHAYLAASPFIEEGHRKVWARLHYSRKICVGRHRILRIMRENRLLSPHRAFQGEDKLHDGRIVTDQPNEMWGTDGTEVMVAEEGLVWIFGAIEHSNAEVVGWHVRHRGRTRIDACSLRADHGLQHSSFKF